MAMAFVTPRMSLKVWNTASDPYDHEQLADNFIRIDQHDHSPGRGARIGGDGIRAGSITAVHIYPGTISADLVSTGSITLDKLATAVQNSLMPVGVILATTGSAAASGFLLCDGTTVSRTTYAGLYAVMGTTYGVGDGSTTFTLPDLRGRVPVGVDGAAARLSVNDALGQTAGEEKHTLTVGELATHTHIQNAHSHTPPEAGTDGFLVQDDTPQFFDPPTSGGAGTQPRSIFTSTANTTATNQNAGSNTPHNNMQPYQVVNYMVKY